ncbi:hypothetical protein WR25_12028 isoform A [Diploscapter pachys]|uniref:F-box domain-containing protein n=1 Tax=Diploscapter pachys TaxID=2018661 RepID=A0A2A2KCW4_9BILA|nr:hypothetical protein WR25_12028 isoform A [Diploscapter pachys]
MSSNSRRWEVQSQNNQNEQLQSNNEPAQKAGTSKEIQEEANEKQMEIISCGDNSYYDFETMKLLRKAVYSNDLIMCHILSYIPNVRDRAKVELCNNRMKYLSGKAKYKFRTEQDHLGIQFRLLYSLVSFRYGNLCIHKPCLTLESRRDDFIERRDAAEPGEEVNYLPNQTKQFMTVMNGMVKRFSKQIRRLTLGGIAKDQDWGVRNHQLIITEDLLRSIATHLPSLTRISFNECGFGDQAIRYLASSECPIPQRIQELNIDGAWFDSKEENVKLIAFATTSLKKLSLRYFSYEMAFEFVARLRAMNHVLEEISMDFPWISSGAECKRLMKEMSNQCKELRLRFAFEWIEDMYEIVPTRCKVHPEIFQVASFACTLPNVTSLHINARPTTPQHMADYTEFAAALRDLKNLRILELHGWTDPRVISTVNNSLPHLTQLENISLLNLPRETPAEEITRFISALSSGVKEFCSHDVVIDGSQLKLLTQRLRLLEKVDIAYARKLVSKDIEDMLHDMPTLREIYISNTAVDVNSIAILLDKNILPKLEGGVLTFANRLPPAATLIFQDHFSSFRSVDIEKTTQCTACFNYRKWDSTMLPRKSFYIPPQKPQKSSLKKKKLDWNDW